MYLPEDGSCPWDSAADALDRKHALLVIQPAAPKSGGGEAGLLLWHLHSTFGAASTTRVGAPVRSYVGAYLATLCAHVALKGLHGNEARRALRGVPFPEQRALCLSLSGVRSLRGACPPSGVLAESG